MRELINIVTEGIDPMPYGYWMSPNGDLYPVGDMQHENAIHEIENVSYGDAIYTGWVRIVCPRGQTKKWMLELGIGPTLEVMRKLRVLLQSIPRGAMVDLHFNGEEENFISYRTSKPEETITLLYAYRRNNKETLAIYDITSSAAQD